MLGMTLARRLFPWIISIAIVGYVIRVVPIEEAWAVLLGTRLEIFVPLVLISVLCWFLIESKAYAYIFSRFNTPISWREARALRASASLLSPIHLGLGKAAVVLRLHALKNVPVLEGTSTVVLYQTIDAIVLASLTVIGLSLEPMTLETNIARAAASAAALVLLLYLSLLRRDQPGFRWLDRMRRLPVHYAHRKIRVRDAIVIVSAKLAYQLVAVAIFYFGARAFDIAVPFTLVLAATPAIHAIGSLPITPGGLGTQQAAMLYFFGNHGSQAAIIAFGFSLPIALMLVRFLLGLVYITGPITHGWLVSPGSRHAHASE